MNTISRLTMAFAILSFAPAAAACEYPPNPAIPDGATATKDEMIEASRAVKAFQAALEEYRACIDEEEAAALTALTDATDEELANRQAALTKKFNATIDQEQLIVARFNDAVVEYRASED